MQADAPFYALVCMSFGVAELSPFAVIAEKKL